MLFIRLKDLLTDFSSSESNTFDGYSTFTVTLPTTSEHEIFQHMEVRIPVVLATKRLFHVVIRKGDKILRTFTNTNRHYKPSEDRHIINLSGYIRPFMLKFGGNIDVDVILQSSNVNQNRHVLFVMYSNDPTFKNKLVERFQNLNSIPEQTNNSLTHNEPIHYRQKRAIRRNSNRTNKNKRRVRRKKCQPRDFIVDYEQIGWGSWFIFPMKFNAKICRGVCAAPVAKDLTPTNHAMLQSLMRVGYTNSKGRPPMPCCVPTRLGPLNMLYYEGEHMVVRLHEDMVVEECGCR